MLFRIQHLDLPGRPFFVLATDGALTADFNSTLFNQQSDLLGSYTYPGTMPLEPNRALILNSHVLSTDVSKRTINALMWLFDSPFKQVKMSFTIDNGTINYNLYYDLSLISNQLKKLKMWQIFDPANDGQLTFDSAADLKAYMTATTTGTKGQYPMVFFPWKNDGAYNADVYVLTPRYDAGIVYNAPTRFLFTDNHIYETTATTTAGQTPVSNPEKFNDVTKYADIGLPVSKIINRWELADDASSGFIIDETFPVSQTVIPAFYLVYLLTRIAQFFGFKAQGSWLQDDNSNKLVLMSNIPTINNTIIPDFTFFMPDILVSDFLVAVRGRFGLLTDPDPILGLFIFESIGNLETKSEIVDLQPYQLSTGFRETGTVGQAFTVEGSFDDKDTAFSDSEKTPPPQLVIGDLSNAIQVTDIPMKDVETKMLQEASPNPVYSTSPLITNWRVPYIKMPIAGATPMDQASTLNRGDEHNFGVRFLIYHGMKPDDGGFNYPYASNDNLDPSMSPMNNYTLQLNSDSGAFSAVAEYYRYMQASKPFEMLFLLPVDKFMAIRNNKRIIVRDVNFASVSCLVDQVSADFVNDKDKVAAKLTLWPRVWADNQTEVGPQIGITEPPPPFDNGTVYIKMNQRNPTTSTTASVPHWTTNQKDIYAEFFEDAAATIPKNVTSLDVKLKIDNYYDGVLTDSGILTINCTSTADESLLSLKAAINTPMGGHEVLHIYSIVATSEYSVIP